MSKEKLKDITIFFKVAVPNNYEEFEKLFPGVFDELEHGHQWGLRRLSVGFAELRKGLGLTGTKRKLFNEWLTRYLNEHKGYWNLYGGTSKAYSEDENFEYRDRRWILIGRRRVTNSENIDLNEHKIDVIWE